ncbi:unnamed protein product [Cylicocyclus nassatus]|uniref:Uncharacterized protein n=1 Tax=Cylicocyclus nassatus TaxID=53992 RepID=A0AA36LYK2_CYLNA|nr:unnamed protein product [Cylicocyclus nassatus]
MDAYTGLLGRGGNVNLTTSIKDHRSLISSLIAGLRPFQTALDSAALEKAAAGLPIPFTSIQAIPSMRNMLALEAGGTAARHAVNSQLNRALEQFTASLVRFANGGQPVASDIQQLIESILNFVVNVPGLRDVDISKLDPSLIPYVLRGGQIPGIPREKLDTIVQRIC